MDDIDMTSNEKPSNERLGSRIDLLAQLGADSLVGVRPFTCWGEHLTWDDRLEGPEHRF